MTKEHDEIDYDAEIEARDYAIVTLTLSCVKMEQKLNEMAQTVRKLMMESSERVDILVH